VRGDNTPAADAPARPATRENPFMTIPGELVVFYPSPRATPNATDTPP
jgi:hypothetical protein